MSAVVYFDCETTGLEDDCSIVCAVTYKAGDPEPRAWHETPAKRLSEPLAVKLATYLLGSDESNTVGTFNGLSFDLPVLMRHLPKGSPLRRKLAQMALFRHKDLCYDFLTATGYCTSLKSFLECTSFQQKQMSGADAAQLVSCGTILWLQIGKAHLEKK